MKLLEFKFKYLLILLAFPLIMCACSSDEPAGVDPDTPGFFEKMLENDQWFTHNGNEYSCSSYDYYYMVHPDNRPLYWPAVVHINVAFSLRKADQEAEILKDLYIDSNTNIADAGIFLNIPVISDMILSESSENSIFPGSLTAYPDITPYCIDGNAFNNCKKLKKVYLDGDWFGISGTSASAFYGCDNLTDIYVCKPIFVESKKFALDYKKVTLHVPAGTTEKFKAEYPWKKFKHIVEDYECEYHKEL